MLHLRWRQARWRAAFDVLAVAMPLAIASAVVAWRVAGPTPALLAAIAAMIAIGFAIVPRWRRHDRDWLVARLDADRGDLEDSSALLFADDAALRPMQQLQRARLEQRLRERPVPDLRPAWSLRAIAVATIVALLAVVAALAWPVRNDSVAAGAAMPSSGAQSDAPPRLVARSLHLQPPAYTGIAATTLDALDAKAPAGSRLRWTLRYAPQPTGVDLVFHDGRRIALRREGEDWTADLVLQASMLYRVVPEGQEAASPLHRLDAIPDQAPRVRLLSPEQTLTLLAPNQRDWRLVFEAEDDHGVAADARLLLTRTEGSGENIRFHEHVVVLRGSGSPRQRRFEARVAPSTYGLQRGEDLIARLEVRDNRAPQPQVVRSASAILRWPAEPVLGADGLDGLARQVLPAYFRSQRQIIIDAEALLKERPKLEADEFEKRSDAIGVDQRLLRLRYGQFLGEESEGGAQAPPTADLPTSDLPTNDHADDDEHTDNDGHDHGPAPAAGHDGHGHDPAPADAPAGFGVADDILETFGHTHDIPEAATLLDPETKETLRGALREMWQSELHLRMAAPEQALPYAHRALALIKQVQQAERIYLARVGTQLPPIDETRRMTGRRDGIAGRALPRGPAPAGDDALDAAWQALASADATAPALDALQRWIDANPQRIDDPLSLVARIDEVRTDPACAECRAALRALLWGAMQRPAGVSARRDAAGAVGRRYLERLRPEPAP
ncbi:DUF4175 domain-containing protein [Luteimonas marina]|uniref:DUF4175 domain-containing protein n=2 Tax=Luteimonas marina TaxID=488485 RepID=A0A5C5TWJ6_9GAMM|nr:DUF4175 domain-containing protein [Luteimonas marina]